MSGEMIERVARVLCSDRGYDPDELEPGDAYGVDGRNRKGEPCHFMWRQFVDTARAAIEAMREPTEGMLADGLGSAAHWADWTPRDVWQAMIATALSE